MAVPQANFIVNELGTISQLIRGHIVCEIHFALYELKSKNKSWRIFENVCFYLCYYHR